ncbi:expressed unknown protein [Seminavis robusta]|uniref:Glutaredoxin domain-containing protein n=1 Tax=Seminavis robusta TaxID=568900 RepID=A0A9N8EYY7_9STRA|nr:expressed unknown protein [Seminavis robusta]|eukprot:Sro2021_g311421.1  (123) ;mRNA; r:6843-7211
MGQGLCKPDVSAVEVTSNERQDVEKLIKTEPVVVFVKTFCPHCLSTKQLLKSHNVEMTVIDLNKEADGHKTQAVLFAIAKQKTVPNTFIGGEHIGGNDDLQKLAKPGLLKEILNQHNIPNSF